MKTKNLLLLLVALALTAVSAGCQRANPIPDPGYRITSYFQLFDPWGDLISTRKDPDKLFEGDLVNAHPGAPGTTGFWRGRTNFSAEFDVYGGIAPGDWDIASLDGVCQGTSFQTFIQRATNKDISCRARQQLFFFTATPDYIDADYPPATVTIYGSGMSTDGGMPSVEYWDQYGYLVAQQYASGVAPDGTSLWGYTPDLSQTYSGKYLLRVRNPNGELIGDAPVHLYKFEPPPPPPPDGDPCYNQDPYGPQMPCNATY